MEFLCTPVIVTAAIFVAILFTDLIRAEYGLLPAHSVLMAVALLLMSTLCYKGMELAAWIFLLTPLLLLVAGWVIYKVQKLKEEVKPVVAVTPAPPTINLPVPDKMPDWLKAKPC